MDGGTLLIIQTLSYFTAPLIHCSQKKVKDGGGDYIVVFKEFEINKVREMHKAKIIEKHTALL